ncbi:uncharacterized protein UTRI_01794 [Ustilago trichophora]|uniref:Uncharacterized protein n=1 Tax=Ustilago trichophora TaxID=86804 RepID=A0A5C3E0W4_9BASI|nr:uncharacterized protein UTRI_01794 [Ustilago trichophora]
MCWEKDFPRQGSGLCWWCFTERLSNDPAKSVSLQELNKEVKELRQAMVDVQAFIYQLRTAINHAPTSASVPATASGGAGAGAGAKRPASSFEDSQDSD